MAGVWPAAPLWDIHNGQGPRQLAELGLALLLSSLIGWERAAQQKSAGLRTHTLVGIASALMMEVSQHGFTAVLGLEHVSFDPSRVAAQIVSGAPGSASASCRSGSDGCRAARTTPPASCSNWRAPRTRPG
ncbi:MgtC/SapB family protein [Streptomyces sp. NPDC048106]|uniref:MgtC/SapB family protein n=1 Tax=Streptomyces sp. NPDC048106 TaxID=3155750 RepID=UPI0034561469